MAEGQEGPGPVANTESSRERLEPRSSVDGGLLTSCSPHFAGGNRKR